MLRSTWLLSFARSEERFYLAEDPTGLAQHPVRDAVRSDRSLDLAVASRSLARSFGARTVCLVGGSSSASVRLAVDLPAGGGAAMVCDPRTGRHIGDAEFRGNNGVGTLCLPNDLVPKGARLFAKVERAFGFFDEAGWKELPPAQPGARSVT